MYGSELQLELQLVQQLAPARAKRRRAGGCSVAGPPILSEPDEGAIALEHIRIVVGTGMNLLRLDGSAVTHGIEATAVDLSERSTGRIRYCGAVCRTSAMAAGAVEVPAPPALAAARLTVSAATLARQSVSRLSTDLVLPFFKQAPVAVASSVGKVAAVVPCCRSGQGLTWAL